MRKIPNWPDYFATRDGRIWVRPRRGTKGGWLRQYTQSSGHRRVDLYRRGVRYPRLVHRLILETFIGPCPVGMECRHLDGDPTNNCIDNLKWGTDAENQRDSVRHGTHFTPRHTKLTERQVRQIIYISHTGLFNQTEVGEQCGVRRNTVNAIVNRRIWKHLWRNF